MKRLQFLMDDERVNELDELVERTGLKTRTQLLNNALTLFEWAVRERRAGRIIASVNEETDKYKEIELPGFPSLGTSAGTSVAQTADSAASRAVPSRTTRRAKTAR